MTTSPSRSVRASSPPRPRGPAAPPSLPATSVSRRRLHRGPGRTDHRPGGRLQGRRRGTLHRPWRWRLLEAFLGNEGKILYRDELLDAAFGPDFRGDSGIFQEQVRRLRRGLGIPAWSEGPIRTVHGVGYAYDAIGEIPVGRPRRPRGSGAPSGGGAPERSRPRTQREPDHGRRDRDRGPAHHRRTHRRDRAAGLARHDPTAGRAVPDDGARRGR